MAKNDHLHDMAKQLLSTKGKKKPIDNVSAKAQPDKKNAVKKAVPKNVAKNAAVKPSPQPTQTKKVPEKARSAAMEKPVAKAAPKAKGSMVEGPMDGMFDKPPPANAKMKASNAVKATEEGAFDALERDLPKAGKKIAIEAAEHLAPTATSRAEMAAIKGGGKQLMEKAAGKMLKGGLMGSVVGGPVGLGLQALMESVDAEDSNPAEHDIAAEHAARSMPSSPSRIAPISHLQTQLPSEVKQAKARSWEYDPNIGPSDQQRMEDDFARELKKHQR